MSKRLHTLPGVFTRENCGSWTSSHWNLLKYSMNREGAKCDEFSPLQLALSATSSRVIRGWVDLASSYIEAHHLNPLSERDSSFRKIAVAICIGPLTPIAHIPDKHIACYPVALPDAMRENKLRARINRGPKPEVGQVRFEFCDASALPRWTRSFANCRFAWLSLGRR